MFVLRHIPVVAALAVAMGTVPLGGVAAHADSGVWWSAEITSNSDPARGNVCAFENGADYTAEQGVYSGELRGGPVELTGLAAAGATLSCQIQVNVDTPTGTGPSVSGHGVGVVTAGPVVEWFVAFSTDDAYLCAYLTDDLTGTTRYWDADHDTWSTSSGVHCKLATHIVTQ
jgi:hypothetical protein